MFEVQGKLILPRGALKSPSPLEVDLTSVRNAEIRLPELRSMTFGSAVDLMGVMNEAASDAMVALAKIQYELLIARQNYDRRRAVVLIDEMPDHAKKLQEKGMKMNEDLREAFIVRDDECFNLRDRIDCLTAAGALIEGKVKTFVRAFNAAKTVAEFKRSNALAPMTSPGAYSADVSWGGKAPQQQTTDTSWFDAYKKGNESDEQ